MINGEQTIEYLLRHAPRPRPSSDLEAKLVAQIQLPIPTGQGSSPQGALTHRQPWLKRWWPALAPATAAAACGLVLTMQQTEIQELRKNIETLSQNIGGTAVATAPDSADPHATRPRSGPNREQEIERLSDLVKKLRSEVAGLEQMRAENEQLRAQLAAPAAFLTTEETAALDKARDHAQSIQCVNNLKQLGLAVRIWATDNGDQFPADLIQMTNEMSTPKILHCPSDNARTEAANFSSYSVANCSYEYLAPGATETDPTRVLWRCPIHGHIGLCDGSVQSGISKSQPDRLIQRDGKLYLRNNATIEMDSKTREELLFRRRYGLEPASPAVTNQQTNP